MLWKSHLLRVKRHCFAFTERLLDERVQFRPRQGSVNDALPLGIASRLMLQETSKIDRSESAFMGAAC